MVSVLTMTLIMDQDTETTHKPLSTFKENKWKLQKHNKNETRHNLRPKTSKLLRMSGIFIILNCL